jgi:hypothetical protein
MYSEEIAAKSKATSKVRGYFLTFIKPTQLYMLPFSKDNSQKGQILI